MKLLFSQSYLSSSSYYSCCLIFFIIFSIPNNVLSMKLRRNSFSNSFSNSFFNSFSNSLSNPLSSSSSNTNNSFSICLDAYASDPNDPSLNYCPTPKQTYSLTNNECILIEISNQIFYIRIECQEENTVSPYDYTLYTNETCQTMLFPPFNALSSVCTSINPQMSMMVTCQDSFTLVPPSLTPSSTTNTSSKTSPLVKILTIVLTCIVFLCILLSGFVRRLYYSRYALVDPSLSILGELHVPSQPVIVTYDHIQPSCSCNYTQIEGVNPQNNIQNNLRNISENNLQITLQNSNNIPNYQPSTSPRRSIHSLTLNRLVSSSIIYPVGTIEPSIETSIETSIESSETTITSVPIAISLT